MNSYQPTHNTHHIQIPTHQTSLPDLMSQTLDLTKQIHKKPTLTSTLNPHQHMQNNTCNITSKHCRLWNPNPHIPKLTVCTSHLTPQSSQLTDEISTLTHQSYHVNSQIAHLTNNIPNLNFQISTLWHQFESKLCIVEAFWGWGVCTFFLQHCKIRLSEQLHIWISSGCPVIVFLADPILHGKHVLAFTKVVHDLAKG